MYAFGSIWFLQAVGQVDAGVSPFAGNGRGKPSGALAMGKPAADAVKHALRQPLVAYEARGTLTRFIETLFWNDDVPQSCTDDKSVEHILPVTGTGEWSETFSAEQRSQLTHTIGNLCLIDRAANASLGNKTWEQKLPIYQERRATCKSIDDAIVGASGAPWGPRVLRRRTERLATLVETALGIETP